MPIIKEVENTIKIIRKDQINEVEDGELFVVIDEDQIIDEAPKDGKAYYRKDAKWEELVFPKRWTPNYTWWDIKKEIENDEEIGEDKTYPNGCIYLCKDNSDSILIEIDGINCAAVITSDGAVYNEIGTFTHTWTGVNDKDCDNNGLPLFKTRWLKLYISKENDYEVKNITDKQVIGCCFSGVGGTSSSFAHCHNLLFIQSTNNKWIGTRKNIAGLFNYCYSLQFIEDFDSAEITSCRYAFNDCHSLTELPIKDFSNVVSAGFMCCNCNSLTSIDLKNSNNIEEFSSAFLKNYSLKQATNVCLASQTDNNFSFAECCSLFKISFTGEIKKISENFLSSNFNLTEIEVEEGSLKTSFKASSNIVLISKRTMLSLLKGCSKQATDKNLMIGPNNLEQLYKWAESDQEIGDAYSVAVYDCGWNIE